MEFNADWVSELPGILFDGWDGPMRQQWEAGRSDLQGDEEGLQLSWYWTLRLAEAFQLGWFPADGGERLPPGFLWSAVGLVQESESSLGHFGVVLYVDSRIARSAADREYPPLQVGENRFPVVARRVTVEDHRSISAPRAGTVSWARTRVGTVDERVGWMTAGHVVDGSSTVDYEDGSTGWVTDIGPGCIDVALVEDGSLPRHRGVLGVRKAVAYGTSASFTGLSTSYPVTVTDVSTSLGVLNASALPVRVGLSSHGVPGDSGSRVDATANNDVLGIYLGRYVDSTGSAAGLAQLADQVGVLMDAEFLY